MNKKQERKKIFKNRYALKTEELFQMRQKLQIEIRRQDREKFLVARRNYQKDSNPYNNDFKNEFYSNISKIPRCNNIKQLDGIRTSNTSSNIGLGEISLHNTLSISQQFYQLIEGLNSNCVEIQLISLSKFRKLLSGESIISIQEIIDNYAIPIFVQFLLSKNVDLRYEAAWILSNISTGSTEQIQAIINAGVLPIFTELLNKTTDMRLQNHILWALGNIAIDNPQFRELILREGNLGVSCQCILDANVQPCSVLRTMSWTLSSIYRGHITDSDWSQISSTFPILTQLINLKDDEILYNVCWALSYLGENNHIEDVINLGVSPHLVNLMVHVNNEVQTAALHCVRSIVSGNDSQRQVIIDCGILTVLKSLLINTKSSIRKDACFILSHITTGNIDQIEHVIHVGLISLAINLMANSDFQTQRETCYSVCNAIRRCYNRPELTICIVRQGCIQPLVNMLNYMDNDIICVVLKAINSILQLEKTLAVENNCKNQCTLLIEEIGGMDRITELQNHENDEIRLLAYNIIDKYFAEEDEGYESELNQSFDLNGQNRFLNKQFNYQSSNSIDNVEIIGVKI
ncbi:importin subunit alpha-1 [Gigaspora margarita]|uniref:Importin subunit alpha n=1 Tax=Gigaspora margarita TaxID=4874 RepID=A0A8H4A3Y5_GIGMA|nr:importin subunit alpha-1 [Gigaspora margarita]